MLEIVVRIWIDEKPQPSEAPKHHLVPKAITAVGSLVH
jgi:hypothetical protein